MDGNTNAKCHELKEFADTIGDFIQYWGFKKVHGRIWAHLFTSSMPLDALEIRQRLNISKALVSLSVRDLIHYAVIRECGKSERGTILYEANPNVKEAICNVLKSRERKMVSQILSAHKGVCSLPDAKKAELNVHHERLNSLGELIAGVTVALEGLLACENLDAGAWKNFMGVSN